MHAKIAYREFMWDLDLSSHKVQVQHEGQQVQREAKGYDLCLLSEIAEDLFCWGESVV